LRINRTEMAAPSCRFKTVHRVLYEGAHWRHLVSTIEQLVGGIA